MNIYHGSLETVRTPKILPRRNGHTCDFGLGFYATTDYNQAERWGRIKMKASQNKNGFVNEYRIDDGLLQNENLKVLKFDCANESWLDFVVGTEVIRVLRMTMIWFLERLRTTMCTRQSVCMRTVS